MREPSVENGGAEIFYDQRKVLSLAGFEPTLPGKEGRPGELPFILFATLVYLVPHVARVAGGGYLFSATHGSLITSSLIRETTVNESANEGYRFGQEEETELMPSNKNICMGR
ncbi:hypothetical protein TIFTF001_032576 [Ficus carica]|uniref:Uncharacterized protein n=1 Tax=Ficus carica TaxID=3494 RepID=A0AA88DWJ5_FICCA|nr:hypothetical protein TIFTF001_032576 [Ficus carica]